MKKISIKRDKIIKASVLSELPYKEYSDKKHVLQLKKQLSDKYGVQFFVRRKTKPVTICKKGVVKSIHKEVFVLC